MKTSCMGAVALTALSTVLPALADDGVRAPRVGDCLKTDYDCQPISLSEEDYDNMGMGVELNRDLPALVELEALDPPNARIQRFVLNARGIMAREVRIERTI